MIEPSIFSYIKSEEARFETDKVKLGDNWEWNFRDHVQLIFHLKNGVFYKGENDYLRAFKNIMMPMLSLSYWTEDIEVKDVTFFIEGPEGRALSFLVKKYHDEVYVREHDLDELFDEITESDVDYGGVLVQESLKRPEVLPLNTIAFCDQTNILGGPIGFKHHFSPSALRKMSKVGWGNPANGADVTIDELIMLAENNKTITGEEKDDHTTGKTIEVYVVRGDLPEQYLKNNNSDKNVRQIQVVAFYTDKDKHKVGVTLYKKEDKEGALCFHTSQKVYNRALGRGDGEALVHPQIWTNFLTIHKTALLEAASKVPLVTDDDTYQNRNKIQEMENLEITTIQEGRSIQQVPTAAPANIQVIKNEIDVWFQHAQLTGSAFDPILGKEANSGTTFKGQERTVAQGRGLHDRRRGKRAKFIEYLYREFIIPRIVSEITGGTEFLATLSPEELSWVMEQLSINERNKKAKEKMLSRGKLEPITEEFLTNVQNEFKRNFARGGNKKLLKILKDEFKDIEVKMGINVANKQKDLAIVSDKLLSIFQFVFANPAGFQQAMQIPALAKSFNDILEFSGLNQADFLSLITPPQPAPAPTTPAEPTQGPAPEPLTLNAQPE